MGMKANSGFFKGTTGSSYAYDSKLPDTYSNRNIDVPDNIKEWMNILSKAGNFVEGNINDFSMKDVSILSKETGVEYAKITIGNKTYLIRGNKTNTDIPNKIFIELQKKGGTFDFHSHPFNDDCMPSIPDKKLMGKLAKITGQKTSKIVTPNGKVSIYSQYGVISIETVKNTIDSDLKQAYLELFGGEE